MTGSAGRRAAHLAPVIAVAASLLLGAWFLSAGRLDVLRWQQYGDFYDAQAHSLLDGHLDIDPGVLGIEAFFSDGRAYMYQGPVPALLRLPVAAIFGDRFDGRLTVISMFAALLVASLAIVRLNRRIRFALREDAPVDRREAVLIGSTLFALIGGSLLLFQTSRAWIYHEAILWGAAFALLAVDQLVRHCLATEDRDRNRAVFWCSIATAAALLTRASIGIGPATGLVLLALVCVARRRRVALHAAAAVWPLAAYAGVNAAKFGSLFSVPFGAQQLALVDPARQAFLEANDGSFFGLQFVPTTLVHYLAPWRIRPTDAFPFLEFPRLPGPTIGDVHFDLLDRSAALPAAAPLLVLLALVGGFIVLRPGAPEALRRLRIPLVAAGGSLVTLFPFGYTAHRYLGDAVPLLALGSIVGLHAWLRHPTATRRRSHVGDALVVGLAFLTTWAGVALTLDYQRLWSTNVAPATVAGFIGLQTDLGATHEVERGDALPPARPEGTLFALGECDGLYLSDGLPVTGVNRTPWNLVEGTSETGAWHLRLRFRGAAEGTIVPILTSGTRDAPNVLVARYLDEDHLRFEYHPTHGLDKVARPVRIDRDRWYHVELVADWRIDRLTVTVGDVIALETFYEERGPIVHLGSNPWTSEGNAQFPGSFRVEPRTASLCHELVGRR